MRVIRVVAALVSRGDAVLVQQRPPGKSRALLWEFPGGKVEPGETDEAALVRECREELDVEASVGPKLWETAHAYQDLRVELVLYRCAIAPDAAPRPLEAAQLAWVDRTKLSDLPFCEADLPLLPLLASGELA
ncbi:MAG TPA: (deoxy)nucleoside triphosphate pyrophosphohydrolase [Vulgatibacter sp.]|nr:(deoxy)nucleoside triphosphate pyrophosphohydrolase [Vulgatibacter sp.]